MAGLYAFLAVDLFALRYYVTYVEPQRLEIRRVRLETPKLTRPVRILHLSDVQSGGIGAYERAIFARIRELSPDLVLNTGDYLQVVPPATFDEELPKFLELVHAYEAPLGTFGVFGDTELEFHRVPLAALEPFTILSSRSVLIEMEGGGSACMA